MYVWQVFYLCKRMYIFNWLFVFIQGARLRNHVSHFKLNLLSRFHYTWLLLRIIISLNIYLNHVIIQGSNDSHANFIVTQWQSLMHKLNTQQLSVVETTLMHSFDPFSGNFIVAQSTVVELWVFGFTDQSISHWPLPVEAM